MLSSGKTSTDVRAETWASKKAQENKVVVAEMRMQCYDGCAELRSWDKIKNERIRGTTNVGEITKKV